ncbi:hypothetical protein MNBD_GAMMA26-2297 [hydrothermal vent metagenome]|uniref:Inner membrane protein YgaP-like transmembrane domain-containing protein n=1 Tax=hydrothermal vent metagenome TaxID=652676 RepID=A0A3B1BS19_9ZZZZ
MMKENVGGIDRILRFAVGMGIIAWGIITQNLWGAIGAIPVFTAVIGWCPAYTNFGICTGRKCKT